MANRSKAGSSTMRGTIALIWGVLVGVPMGLAAYLADLPVAAAGMVAILGGLGAAAFGLVFWTRPTGPRTPPAKE